MDTQFFIHMSLGQPSAHEFTKYMGSRQQYHGWSQRSMHVTRPVK